MGSNWEDIFERPYLELSRVYFVTVQFKVRNWKFILSQTITLKFEVKGGDES